MCGRTIWTVNLITWPTSALHHFPFPIVTLIKIRPQGAIITTCIWQMILSRPPVSPRNIPICSDRIRLEASTCRTDGHNSHRGHSMYVQIPRLFNWLWELTKILFNYADEIWEKYDRITVRLFRAKRYTTNIWVPRHSYVDTCIIHPHYPRFLLL